MEKRTPHCKLQVIKALITDGKIRATRSALSGAELLDIDFDGMVSIINTLTPADFYKSMTTHAKPYHLARCLSTYYTLWQPIYQADRD